MINDYVNQLKFGAKCHTANAVILSLVLVATILFFAVEANYILQAKIIITNLVN